MDIAKIKQQLVSDPEVRDMVARRAFEIYVQRHGGPGSAAEDWLRAESEILAPLVDEIATENHAAIEKTEVVAAPAKKPARRAAAKPAAKSSTKAAAKPAAKKAPARKAAAKPAPAAAAAEPVAKKPARKASAKKKVESEAPTA